MQPGCLRGDNTVVVRYLVWSVVWGIGLNDWMNYITYVWSLTWFNFGFFFLPLSVPVGVCSRTAVWKVPRTLWQGESGDGLTLLTDILSYICSGHPYCRAEPRKRVELGFVITEKAFRKVSQNCVSQRTRQCSAEKVHSLSTCSAIWGDAGCRDYQLHMAPAARLCWFSWR